jgi:hypothetical protein
MKDDGCCHEGDGQVPKVNAMKRIYACGFQKSLISRHWEVLFRRMQRRQHNTIFVDKIGAAPKRGSGPRGPNAALLSARRSLHDYSTPRR